MEYAFTQSGNVIAKDSKIQGAAFIVNKGKSYIGHSTVIHGDRNNGKPIISWDQFVILGDRAVICPAERKSKFYPVVIGHHVSIGESTEVQAASIGSHVIIGNNCRIGQFAILKDCVMIPDNSHVPPYAVVGPSTKFKAGGESTELPEAAEDAIDFYCESILRGTRTNLPEF